MRSVIRSLWVISLVLVSAASAELSFVAKVEQEGQEVDASSLGFVPIPPLAHRKHASRPLGGSEERDPVSYSSNWCGASQHSTPSEPITNVFSFFTVPDLMLRPEVPAPQFAAAWVGIDGAECKSALLQAGVTTIVRACIWQLTYAWEVSTLTEIGG